MIYLAYCNLFQNKIRLVISVGGVALALLLILGLDAIFTGVQRQITAYIDQSGADIFVSQSGVRNLHMASSSLPAVMIDKVQRVEGVAQVTPILYLTNMVEVGEERNVAYIIGIPRGARVGIPWKIAAGTAELGIGEVILDRGVAEGSGVGLGDEVKVMGETFRVAGLSDDTASLVNSIAFIRFKDFQSLLGKNRTVSFLLVTVLPGQSPQAIAEQIEKRFGDDVTAQTRTAFASQERQVVQDMSTDIVTIMNLAGFLIGLAVLALTVYTATLSRRSEFGVLKALGARNSRLYWVVLFQALISVSLGLGVGLACTLGLAWLLPRLGLNLALVVSPDSLVKVGVISLIIASFSALLPVRQIARLDPASVFRK